MNVPLSRRPWWYFLAVIRVLALTALTLFCLVCAMSAQSLPLVKNGKEVRYQPEYPFESLDVRLLHVSTLNADSIKFVHVPGTAQLFGGGVTLTAPNGEDIVLHVAQDFRFRGWNYGNAPGAVDPVWSFAKGTYLETNFFARGINQPAASFSFDYAIGDTANYHYLYCDGGRPDWSGEGCSGMSIGTGQNPNFYHGFVSGSPGAGALMLPLTFSAVALSRDVTSDGSFMLNLSAPSKAGHFVGLAAQLAGMGPATFSEPTDATFTPSTAWGSLNTCNLLAPVQIGGDGTRNATCSVTAMAGASPLHAGLACIVGDTFPEQVILTSPGVQSGGAQTASFVYRYPHTDVSIWQGGPCGMFRSTDQNILLNGFYASTPISGAVDASHIVTTGFVGRAPDSPYVGPLALANLVRTGSFVKAIINVGGTQDQILNGVTGAIIAGCSDAALNGPTGLVTLSGDQLSYTWAWAGSGASCPNATISIPPAFTSFHAYCGAEVVGPQSAYGAPAPLGPNGCQWNTGDALVEPQHPIFAGSGRALNYSVNDTNEIGDSAADSITMTGAAFSGRKLAMHWMNSNPGTNFYRGMGGTKTLAPWIVAEGVNGGIIRLSSSPINGQPLILVNSPNNLGCNGNQGFFYLPGTAWSYNPNGCGSNSAIWNLGGSQFNFTGGVSAAGGLTVGQNYSDTLGNSTIYATNVEMVRPSGGKSQFSTRGIYNQWFSGVGSLGNTGATPDYGATFMRSSGQVASGLARIVFEQSNSGQDSNWVRSGYFDTDSSLHLNSGLVTTGAKIPSLAAVTGTRFVCVDTTGTITSSVTACSGT